MEEVALQRMPRYCREVFAFLLAYTMVANPIALWNRFLPDMSEDFRRQSPVERAETRTWEAVEKILADDGMSLDRYGIPCPSIPEDEREEVPLGDPAMWATLNEDQRSAAERIVCTAQSEGGGALFIDGRGGTGKTYMYNTLYGRLRSLGIPMVCVTYTAIATTLLKGGTTAHKRFCHPLRVSPIPFASNLMFQFKS
jgi:hypothetical protein